MIGYVTVLLPGTLKSSAEAYVFYCTANRIHAAGNHYNFIHEHVVSCLGPSLSADQRCARSSALVARFAMKQGSISGKKCT